MDLLLPNETSFLLLASLFPSPHPPETGKVVQVPLFIETGDRVKVDTRSGDYLTRV